MIPFSRDSRHIFFNFSRFVFCSVFSKARRSRFMVRRLSDMMSDDYGHYLPSRLETKRLEDLGIQPSEGAPYVQIDEYSSQRSNFNKLSPFQSLENTVYLTSVVRWLRPERILEIGTHRGVTTINIHMNSAERCELITIDPAPLYEEHAFTKKYFDSHSITPLKIKSSELETKKYRNYFDLIFIDGDHSFEGVKRDTEMALSLIKKGGVILWDDYAYSSCPEVNDYLNALCNNLDGLYRLKDTTLAIYRHK